MVGLSVLVFVDCLYINSLTVVPLKVNDMGDGESNSFRRSETRDLTLRKKMGKRCLTPLTVTVQGLLLDFYC